AGDLAERLEGDTGVERGRIELLVAEQHLDYADVRLLLEQVCGEAMPQRVQRDGLVDLGHHRRGVAGAGELARGQRLPEGAPGKQPAPGPRRLPPGPHQAEGRRREHRVSILATFALFDPDDHPGTVDVLDFERDDLGGAQSRAISDTERRLVLKAGGRIQQARHLLWARQLPRFADERQADYDL